VEAKYHLKKLIFHFLHYYHLSDRAATARNVPPKSLVHLLCH
jgi:hypothetical protein